MFTPCRTGVLGMLATFLTGLGAAQEPTPAPVPLSATARGHTQRIYRGVFTPDMTEPPDSFAALKARIAEARSGLQTIAPGEVDGLVGRDMRFSFGERHIDFRAEEFLLTFSQPNFYFHATTAYDILRWQGVPIGKRDFLGRLRHLRMQQ